MSESGISFDPFSYFISSAEAQPVVPTTQAPPLPTGSSGSGQVLPNAAAQAAGMVQTPDMPDESISSLPPGVTPGNFGMPPEELNQGDYGVNNRIIREGRVYDWDEEKESYVDKNGIPYYRYFGEFVADELPDFFTTTGKTSPIRPGDTLVGNWKGSDVYKDQDTEEFYHVLGGGTIRSGFLPWQYDDIEFLDEEEIKTVPEPKKKTLQELELKPGTEELIPDAAIPPKPDEKEIGSKVEDIINAANNNSNTGSPDPDETPPEPDPTIVDKAKGYFTQMFSDLFNGPELARMAVMYAGSRALGYDHGGSISYAMKNYLERVDASVAARQEFVTDKDNLEYYTEATLQKYRKTGDLSVLEPKTTGYSAIGMGDNVWHEEYGVLPTVKVGDGEYAIEYAGQYLPFDHPLRS